ncbi:MAG: LPS export ABC transporter permease LptG [Gammaproteobacteria bacterium]|nr:LPS export ABC transporter permease LptG [Gammaproteobacteria bacterium]MBP9729187.1 LPS export ABC transporter permease LptG [Gammaproteobacteria bacterium]
MRIIDRYIIKQLIKAILVVALALAGFDYFFNLVQELKVVGRGHYDLIDAITYLSLTMPTRLYGLFPWAALVGALLGLGSLASRSELVVMRSSGISTQRITQITLQAALWVTVAMLLLGEWMAPISERFAEHKRTTALSGGQSIQTHSGLWVKQGLAFIHIQSVKNDNELEGVTRYQFDTAYRLEEALFAERATLVGKVWKLYDVRGTRFLQGKIHTFEAPTQTLLHLVEPEILETATIKHPERLSLPALWRAMHYRSKHQLDVQNYTLAFWTKIFQPFVIIMMVFLGLSFVFGPLRSVSMGSRLVCGILVAFSFHTLNHLIAPLAIVYQVPPVLAVLLPIMVFAGFGAWMLYRVK